MNMRDAVKTGNVGCTISYKGCHSMVLACYVLRSVKQCRARQGGKSASQSILFHWLMTSQLTKYTKEIQYVTSANYQLTFWCLVATNWPLCCTGSCLRGRIMCSNAVGLKCANKFWICWGKWRDTQASISSYAQLGTLLTFLCCAGPLPSWQNINFFNVCVRSLNVPQMWGYVRMNRYQNN